MSVSLTPKDEENFEEPEKVNIANLTWLAMTAFAKAYGEDVEMWGGFHDPQFYSPEQLRSMADRIEQIEDSPKWLRRLADKGGAILG